MYFQSLAAALLLSLGVVADVNSSTATHHVASAVQPPQHWQHNNLVRSINLEKGYAREYVNVVIENISPEAQDEYYIPFEADRMGRVGSLEVKDKKLAGSVPFVVDLLGNDAYRSVLALLLVLGILLTLVKCHPVLPSPPSQATSSLRTTDSHDLLCHPLLAGAHANSHWSSRQAIPHLLIQRLPLDPIQDSEAEDQAEVP